MNLQTWVVFLEFFGIGRAPEDVNMTQQQQEALNTEGQIKGTLCQNYITTTNDGSFWNEIWESSLSSPKHCKSLAGIIYVFFVILINNLSEKQKRNQYREGIIYIIFLDNFCSSCMCVFFFFFFL